jgi:hypothetical protein
VRTQRTRRTHTEVGKESEERGNRENTQGEILLLLLPLPHFPTRTASDLVIGREFGSSMPQRIYLGKGKATTTTTTTDDDDDDAA